MTPKELIERINKAWIITGKTSRPSKTPQGIKNKLEHNSFEDISIPPSWGY